MEYEQGNDASCTGMQAFSAGVGNWVADEVCHAVSAARLCAPCPLRVCTRQQQDRVVVPIAEGAVHDSIHCTPPACCWLPPSMLGA